MSTMDPSEKKVIGITGAVLALFIFSILYARGRNNELTESQQSLEHFDSPWNGRITELVMHAYRYRKQQKQKKRYAAGQVGKQFSTCQFR